MKEKHTHDSNWISYKRIYNVCVVALIFILLSLLIFVKLIIGLIALVLALLLIALFIYFLYARHQFSPEGKDIQNKIYNLLLDYIEFNGQGKIIDIGCGDGTFIIKLARKYPKAEITGIDNWESIWGYTKEGCIKKAENEDVLDRVNFEKANASKLPYKDETFDLAISNFVFHEVKDEKNKRKNIKEALRVIKKGGSFVFQDMFLSKFFYGESDDLLNEIKSWGIRHIKLVDTSKSDFIPRGLKLPFMTGKMAIIYGTK